jgi:glycosidase
MWQQHTKIKAIACATSVTLIAMAGGCSPEKETKTMAAVSRKTKKEVIYQVFTRLFGNTNTTNLPWGTLEENGVGKFSDFTKKALLEIKDLGVTYIWYTGVPHHALVTDYSEYGIAPDDPDVVKGRAGSPYAVKDYYNVNPDLANDPSKRMEEFIALIQRTHDVDMKVIIDIVPNHVARDYQGKSTPATTEPFGVSDDTTLEYLRDNNFYYIPGQAFEVPDWGQDYRPLGGEEHPDADGMFHEVPAKWTGNGARQARPGVHDWYETVKVNYGVRPDGTLDFAALPAGYEHKSTEDHLVFWKGREVPDSWIKFKEIAMYWLEKGVDGFRYDMAEMVPVEFWSYLNSNIKHHKPDAFLLAEVYNPALYRAYIHKGKMDYLYDKVEFYDSLKHIMQGHGWTDHIPVVQNGLQDIEHHMLHFLENHDEQRIASPEFAGDALKGKPAMVVSATISTSPTMIYFGQEVGEAARENAGFGKPSRTSIFDYIGVPAHQRWVNGKRFDGGQLSPGEKELRDFYKRLMNFVTGNSAVMGKYQDIHYHNREHTENYNVKVLTFVRWSDEEKILVTSNFDDHGEYRLNLKLPAGVIQEWGLGDGLYAMEEMLYGGPEFALRVEGGSGSVDVELQPLESLILRVKGDVNK